MILVVPPGGETLAPRIFNLLHYGHNAQVNALCLTLLAVAVVPLLLWKAWSIAHASRFTLHASRSTPHAPHLLLLPVVVGLLFSGCSPSSHSNDAPLKSQ